MLRKLRVRNVLIFIVCSREVKGSVILVLHTVGISTCLWQEWPRLSRGSARHCSRSCLFLILNREIKNNNNNNLKSQSLWQIGSVLSLCSDPSPPSQADLQSLAGTLPAQCLFALEFDTMWDCEREGGLDHFCYSPVGPETHWVVLSLEKREGCLLPTASHTAGSTIHLIFECAWIHKQRHLKVTPRGSQVPRWGWGGRGGPALIGPAPGWEPEASGKIAPGVEDTGLTWGRRQSLRPQ